MLYATLCALLFFAAAAAMLLLLMIFIMIACARGYFMPCRADAYVFIRRLRCILCCFRR